MSLKGVLVLRAERKGNAAVVVVDSFVLAGARIGEVEGVINF